MRAVIGLRALAAVAVVLAGASVAFGVGITAIGALTPAAGGNIDSRVYAISPDGMYAVGASNGSNVAGDNTISQAVIWSAGSGLVQLPNAPELPMIDLPTSARGVVVKANGDIGVAAYANNFPTTSDYRMAHYTATAGALGAGTYIISPGTSNFKIGEYNAARMYENGSGNDWSIAGQRSNSARAVQSNSWGGYSDSGVLKDFNRIYNVSSRVPGGSGRGYAAGYEYNKITFLKRASFASTGSTQFLIPGTADSITGQSESLGMSPYTTLTAGSGVIVGYDADVDGTARAFSYAMAGYSGTTLYGTRTLLSERPGAVSSQAIDVRLLGPVGQQEMIIGGFMAYDGWEQAVIWDKTGTWVGCYSDNAWSVYGLLSAAGQDLTGWRSLSRVTSISDDGKTIGGWGVWEDGTTRGFIATIPEPASLLLLSLGGLALLRRNRR